MREIVIISVYFYSHDTILYLLRSGTVIPFDQFSWLMAQVTCFRVIHIFSWVKAKIFIYISTIFENKPSKFLIPEW